MAYSEHYRPQGVSHERLKKWIATSLIIHGIIFSLLFVKETFFPGEPIRYIPTLRVDLVGLPDILKKDLENIPPKKSEINQGKTQTQDEKPAPQELVFKTKSKKQRQEEEKIMENKRQDKMKSALQRIKALQKIKDSTQENVVIKGNLISPGTQVTGEAREAAEAGYLDAVHERLKLNWTLPPWLQRKNLNARVRIFINSRGRIDQLRFEQESGEPAFDNAIRQTLLKSEPFPLPPTEIGRVIKANGILLGFPL